MRFGRREHQRQERSACLQNTNDLPQRIVLRPLFGLRRA
jgi:hypothetical protein